jgi:hypothetical protein
MGVGSPRIFAAILKRLIIWVGVLWQRVNTWKAHTLPIILASWDVRPVFVCVNSKMETSLSPMLSLMNTPSMLVSANSGNKRAPF